MEKIRLLYRNPALTLHFYYQFINRKSRSFDYAYISSLTFTYTCKSLPDYHLQIITLTSHYQIIACTFIFTLNYTMHFIALEFKFPLSYCLLHLITLAFHYQIINHTGLYLNLNFYNQIITYIGWEYLSSYPWLHLHQVAPKFLCMYFPLFIEPPLRKNL